MALDIKVQENSVAIVGWHDGAAGQIHTWLEKAHDYHIACFINPDDRPLDIDPKKIQRDVSQFSYPTNNSFKDKPLINSSKWVEILKDLKINKVLVTSDDTLARRDQIHLARKHGFKLINAIHPTALIMEGAILYDNIILYANTFIGYRTELFPGVIVTSAHLEHHNVIRECAFIAPGVLTAGNVTIGALTRVLTGAVIKNRVRIGDNCIVDVGAVILEDMPNNINISEELKN